MDSLQAARVLCSLAISCGDMGRYKQQMNLLRRALRIYEGASRPQSNAKNSCSNKREPRPLALITSLSE